MSLVVTHNKISVGVKRVGGGSSMEKVKGLGHLGGSPVLNRVAGSPKEKSKEWVGRGGVK